jgi:hypothetical protein
VILKMVEVDSEKYKYRQFVELLNTLRRKALVSAQQRREFDKRWRAEPELRDLVYEELERINDEYTERCIS